MASRLAVLSVALVVPTTRQPSASNSLQSTVSIAPLHHQQRRFCLKQMT